VPVLKKVNCTLRQSSNHPNPKVLHLSVFMRVHIFLFSPSPLPSPFFFFCLKWYIILLLYFSLSQSIFLLWKAWITPKLIPSANSSVIYSGVALCLLWNCAHFYLRSDIFSCSVFSCSGYFPLFFNCLSSKLKHSRTLILIIYLSISSWPLFFLPFSPIWILHLASLSCGFQLLFCSLPKGKRKRESK